MSEFKIFTQAEGVAQAAADFLFENINQCTETKGVCHIVLPGGSTPARVLELLATKPLAWHKVHWYPGDERCYPVGHEERNDTMIMSKLFANNKDASENFHPIPAELGAQQGAECYTNLLDNALVNAAGHFDIVVLGMGEDGHTASLFPDNPALQDNNNAVAVFNAPKAPDERVSIGLKQLKAAAIKIVITTGEAKYPAIKEIKQGAALPIAMVEPHLWFVDEFAVIAP